MCINAGTEIFGIQGGKMLKLLTIRRACDSPKIYDFSFFHFSLFFFTFYIQSKCIFTVSLRCVLASENHWRYWCCRCINFFNFKYGCLVWSVNCRRHIRFHWVAGEQAHNKMSTLGKKQPKILDQFIFQ